MKNWRNCCSPFMAMLLVIWFVFGASSRSLAQNEAWEYVGSSSTTLYAWDQYGDAEASATSSNSQQSPNYPYESTSVPPTMVSGGGGIGLSWGTNSNSSGHGDIGLKFVGSAGATWVDQNTGGAGLSKDITQGIQFSETLVLSGGTAAGDGSGKSGVGAADVTNSYFPAVVNNYSGDLGASEPNDVNNGHLGGSAGTLSSTSVNGFGIGSEEVITNRTRVVSSSASQDITLDTSIATVEENIQASASYLQENGLIGVTYGPDSTTLVLSIANSGIGWGSAACGGFAIVTISPD